MSPEAVAAVHLLFTNFTASGLFFIAVKTIASVCSFIKCKQRPFLLTASKLNASVLFLTKFIENG